VIKKLKKNLIWVTIVSALIYLALSIYADYKSVLKALEIFPVILLPLLLLMSFGNYTIRFLKYHYYLKLLNIRISPKESFHIFMAGLIMSITPGKFWEALKAYLVKLSTDEPVSKTLPVMFAERITDFYSLLIIALIGAFYFDYGKTIVIITSLFFILLTLIIASEKFSLKIISLLGKVKLLNKYTTHMLTAYESAYALLKLKPLYEMTFISIFAWILECLEFHLILMSFNINVSALWSGFAYAFATIVGSITMLPAGLGITDGSLTYFVFEASKEINIAVAATLITRAVTLWFAVLIGIFALWLYKKKFGEKLESFDEENA